MINGNESIKFPIIERKQPDCLIVPFGHFLSADRYSLLFADLRYNGLPIPPLRTFHAWVRSMLVMVFCRANQPAAVYSRGIISLAVIASI
jgi:hypothetical protein